MKGTLISILVGAVAGVLLTVGSSVHASRAAASRAAAASAVTRTEAAAAARPADAPATPDEHAPPAK
jgi:hypothetical protein